MGSCKVEMCIVKCAVVALSIGQLPGFVQL